MLTCFWVFKVLPQVDDEDPAMPLADRIGRCQRKHTRTQSKSNVPGICRECRAGLAIGR